MLLSSLLDSRFVKIKVPARSKADIVHTLLDEMFTHYHFQVTRPEIESALQAREALGSTVLPSGLAVPHARIELFNDILIGVATPETPFEENGVLVRMVVLILTSRTTSNLYLNCLSAFTRLSRDPEAFNRLIQAANADEVINHLQVLNIEVKPELTVEHIMVTGLITVEPTMPVKTVINLMCEHHFSWVPVVASTGTFMGEISVLEIMRLGIPNYAQMIGNSSFLKGFEPLEELLAKEETVLARDIMEPTTNYFSRQTSVVEAVFTFTKTRKRRIPVLENRQIVGMVSYMDILTKVLRA